MARAVYRIYASLQPKPTGGEAEAAVAKAIAAIGAAAPMKLLEAAVNRQSRLATRISIEKNLPEPRSVPPLLKDATPVVDLRLRVSRGRFEAWNFASVHRQLAEAESALAQEVELRLDEELRKAGLLNGARVAASAQLVGSRGFFGGGSAWLWFMLLGAVLGAAGVATAAHQGVDVAAAVEQLLLSVRQRLSA